MRLGQNRRMRGRNRNNKGPNPLTRNYESNGPDVKIRGTAQHVAEKYSQLARDAQAAGDPIAAENYLQHAEHYFRIIAASQEQMRQQYGQYQRPTDDDMEDGDIEENGNGFPYDRSEQSSSEEMDPAVQPQPSFSYDDSSENRRERQPRPERRSRYGRIDRNRSSSDSEARFSGESEGEESAERSHTPRRDRFSSRQEQPVRPVRGRQPSQEADTDAAGALPAFLTNPVRQPATGKPDVSDGLFSDADVSAEAPKPVRRRRRVRSDDEAETGIGGDI